MNEIIKVSIIIPTRDRAKSLGLTLESLNAVFVPKEISLQVIIVLDGCTDNSNKVVEQWHASFQHTATIVYTTGLGAGGARNSGLDHAKGTLIGFMDDDVIPLSLIHI